MIGSSNGKTYEDSVDHFLGNPIEDDFDAMKSGRKPIQEPPKDRPSDVIDHFPSTPFEKWWIKSYIGHDKPESVNSLDNRRNIQIQRMLDEMRDPGPIDKQITPGEQIRDPQGQGRDVRVSDADERPIAGQQYAMEDKRIIVPEGPGRASGGGAARAQKYLEYMESVRPTEKVDRPAIKIGDELFEGRPGESHYHVMVNNGRLQKMPGKDMDRMESGWMTNTGRYVGREEAMSIANKAEQVKTAPRRWKDDDFSNKELISEDFKGGRPPKFEAGPMISNSDDGMKQFLDALSKFIPRRK